MFSSRFLAVISGALFALGFACLTQAQIPMTGAGLGKPNVAAGYSGPGDVVAGASFWYAVQRCYSTAYTGNVADIYAPLDASHTLLTCSSGGTINQTLQALATTCASSCTVKTLYDQSGDNSCGGGACDVTQATIANRPVVTLNFSNSRACAQFTSSSSQTLRFVGNNVTFSQPFTRSMVGEFTVDSGIQFILSINPGSGLGFRFGGQNAFTLDETGANVLSRAVTVSTLAAVQSVSNGASPNSLVNVDGTSTTGTLDTAGATNQNINIGSSNGTGNFADAIFCETGQWSSKAFSGAELTNMSANQHGSNGYNF